MNQPKSGVGGRSFVRDGLAGRDDRCVSESAVVSKEASTAARDLVRGLGGGGYTVLLFLGRRTLAVAEAYTKMEIGANSVE